MTTTTNVKQTKLNIMTQAQYNSATKNATELYMVTDAQVSYNDLTDKPTIPTVNNATLTITQGGTPKGTFTANANSDVTIALDAGGGGGGLSYTATCPAITITDGVATWAVTHNLGTQSVVATLYNVSTGAEIEKNIIVTSNNTLTVAWKASSNVTSGAYKIVVLASGASSDISNMQTTDNLVTSISSSSTDTQYPSAKLLYDQLALKSGINLWTSNYKAFYNNQSLSVSTVPTSYTIDLSTYLPNDGAEYEVMFRYNTNNAHNAMINTDVANNIGQLYESNNNGQRSGQLILPIGSGRSLTFKVYTALNNFTFSAGAYRKVG